MNALPSHVGFAVLGYGRIGQRHARLIQAQPRASLMAIADPAARDTPVVSFPTLGAMLQSDISSEIDIVSIATPNGLHVAQAMECLRAGKHVMIEKPVALRKSDVSKLVKLALAENLHIFPVLQNRFTPGARWLKSIVDSGVLGTTFLVQVNCFWNRDQRYYRPGSWHGTAELDGGVLFTQFSHFVDLLIWLFGPLTDVQALTAQSRHWTSEYFPDTGSLQFRLHPSGLGTCQFSTATWDKNMESSISILAEHGSLKVNGQYLERLEYCHVQPEIPAFPSAAWNPEQGHKILIDNVVGVLCGQAEPAIEASEAMKTVELIESIYKQIPS